MHFSFFFIFFLLFVALFHISDVRSDVCGDQEAVLSQTCRKTVPKLPTKTYELYCCNLLIVERCILDSVDNNCATNLQQNYANDPLKKSHCAGFLSICNSKFNLNLPYIQSLPVQPEVVEDGGRQAIVFKTSAIQTDQSAGSTQLLSRKPVFESSTATQHSPQESHIEPTDSDAYRVSSHGSDERPLNDQTIASSVDSFATTVRFTWTQVLLSSCSLVVVTCLLPVARF